MDEIFSHLNNCETVTGVCKILGKLNNVYFTFDTTSEAIVPFVKGKNGEKTDRNEESN